MKLLYDAPSKKPLSAGDEGVVTMRVWPSDLDFYPELNNGRHLTLMDLGRIDLAIRTGLLSMIRRNRWGLVVAGAGIRYRHRLMAFKKFTLRTRIVGHDGKWFYFHQSTERDGITHSEAIIRAGVTSRTGIVPVHDILKAMGQTDWPPGIPDWVRSWADSEHLWPWSHPHRTTVRSSQYFQRS